MKWWLVLKDVAFTAGALYVLVTQDLSAHPSDVMLTAAIVLAGVGVGADHAKKLLSSSTGAPPSPSPGESSSPPSGGSSGD